METFDEIFDSMQGFLIPEASVPWVENAFVPGSLYEEEYGRMREAYERLCLRLGVNADEGDDDLNTMVEALEAIQRELCKRIFRCGQEYAQKYARG